jgi:hypothetical protein
MKIPLLVACLALIQVAVRPSYSDDAAAAGSYVLGVSADCQRALSSRTLGAVDELGCALWVESGAQSVDGVPGPLFLAFLRADREDHSFNELSAAIQGATPAGRVYLATLMFRKDRETGRAALQDIADEPYTIFYQHGCIIPGEERSAGEIARSVLSGSPPPGLRP